MSRAPARRAHRYAAAEICNGVFAPFRYQQHVCVFEMAGGEVVLPLYLIAGRVAAFEGSGGFARPADVGRDRLRDKSAKRSIERQHSLSVAAETANGNRSLGGLLASDNKEDRHFGE